MPVTVSLGGVIPFATVVGQLPYHSVASQFSCPPSHCVISCTALNESDLVPLDQCVPVSVLNESVLLPVDHCVSLSVC